MFTSGLRHDAWKLPNQGKEALDILPFAANGSDFLATIDEQKLNVYKWLKAWCMASFNSKKVTVQYLGNLSWTLWRIIHARWNLSRGICELQTICNTFLTVKSIRHKRIIIEYIGCFVFNFIVYQKYYLSLLYNVIIVLNIESNKHHSFLEGWHYLKLLFFFLDYCLEYIII